MTPAERYESIMARVRVGHTKADIARALGIHPTRVGQIVRRGPPKGDDAPPVKMDRRKKYGHLRYIGPATFSPAKGQHGLFRCDCGTAVVLRCVAVCYGNNHSCGCRARNRPGLRKP